MRIFILTLFLSFLGYSAYSSVKTDSLLTQLKVELSKIKTYDGQKEQRINKLKARLDATPKTDYNTQYNICSELYEEYKSYQFETAYAYTQKMMDVSKATHSLTRENDTKIRVAFLLLSSGMFKEAFESLQQINTRLLNDSSKLEYYAIKERAYSDLADYNNDKNFAPFDKTQSLKYLDSAIALSKPNSFDLLRHMGDRQIRSGQAQKPFYYINLLNNYPLTAHQRAMAATALSAFYQGPEHADDRIALLAIGAINDIRSSTKETLAIFKLGQELYSQGNVNDAYAFIKQAMDDAEFYGARLRKIKIGAVLPIIAAKKIILAENEKNKFLIYLLSITVVAILISLVSFIVFIQLKRLKVKEKIIEEKNILLEKINDKLIEDTHIKEEYIGYFFNVISGYILKLEKLKRNVERKITIKKYDDVLLSVNEINIKKEREALFYTFDHIFLKIFPNFISTFNSLFKKEDQIWPKDNEVLNTDLRIFALMRLGISDVETIANILEYSVNTIYVYKMRIKAKALVPSDEFDHRIMDIKAIEVLNKA
ncbi:MAG: tetratricopeptide repeat protein [Mucilaginibacter sp.]|nr:tetratricopeptide repeat protein [Mucilaginibacter sp.]